MYELSLVELLEGPYGREALKLRLPDDVWPPTYRRKTLRGVPKRNAYARGSDFARRFWHAIHEPHATEDRAIVVVDDDDKPVALAVHWDNADMEGAWRYSHANVGFYVKPKYRRSGVGKRLFKRAKKKWDDMVVYSFDNRSGKFFNSVGAKQ